MVGADHDCWEPLQPAEVARMLRGCTARWWIAGGYAIDLFVGELDRRPHEDLDVGLLAPEQDLLRASLAGWDLHCADPPGTLRPWRRREFLTEPIHDVWAREQAGGPWRLQLVLNPSDSDTWIYRRDARIRRPVASLVERFEGIPYLAPEVQLLFKSKAVRPKDEQDLVAALPLLEPSRREWLREAMRITAPEHPWLQRL
ncbi:MAG TPA: hypothetical protein VK926_03370 [Gaiellaceae bacterium]|nr:hypothetical protein [Gaiellaceae bacterium]